MCTHAVSLAECDFVDGVLGRRDVFVRMLRDKFADDLDASVAKRLMKVRRGAVHAAPELLSHCLIN